MSRKVGGYCSQTGERWWNLDQCGGKGRGQRRGLGGCLGGRTGRRGDGGWRTEKNNGGGQICGVCGDDLAFVTRSIPIPPVHAFNQKIANQCTLPVQFLFLW